MDDKTRIAIERLKNLEPIAHLSAARWEELAGLAYVEKLAAGMSVFREGDVDNQTIYLLDGELQVNSASGSLNKVLNAKAATAKFPIDDSQPRQASCVTLSRAEILRLDNSVLDYMMMWDQLAVSEQLASPTNPVAGLEPDTSQVKPRDPEPKPATDPDTHSVNDEEVNWMRRMENSMAFKNIPPANIKSLLERMETLLVEKDQTIVKQGELGDYFYVLTEGTAQVTRTIELAALQPGACFGEEALVSGGARNANVTMQSSGMVMRLAKSDFDELLKEPLLNRISAEQAHARVSQGALWLDVRHAKEYHHSRLSNAINIPLHELRMRMTELEAGKEYICYCGTGRRSSAAAFLLAQHGYKTSVLTGGVQGIAQDLVR
ncbi:MAG: cyclic nucleotide-binding domain-containing protein [Gammaproteobacteria bacterium]|nr:cyclic nucleotide-binding domain-containing protein [Gammaproteobacteria bacterium]